MHSRKSNACQKVSNLQSNPLMREKGLQMARVARQNGGVIHTKRQRHRRQIFKPRVGIGTARWLLAAILTATITSVSCVDRPTKDDVVSECHRLYEMQSFSTLPVSFIQQDHVEIKTESIEGWRLLSFLKFHDLHTVDERENGRTVLCVGLVDATSFSSKVDAGDPDAVFTIDTFKEVPVGFVRVGTMCWLNYKNFRDCDPSFMPLSHLANLPQLHHSPLEEHLWTKMAVDMGLKHNWIWSVDSKTKKGYIPSEWIYKMNITSLQSLRIWGNDWSRPKHILKAMPHLWKLDLSYNKLEAIPDDMLMGMPSLRELLLSHNNISEYPRSVKHLPNLGRLDLTNPLGNAILTIEDEDIRSFPRTLYNFGAENNNLHANVSNMLVLPHLEFLNLSGCALGHINDFELIENKSGLVTIDFSNNGLKYLPLNIFKDMPKLRELLLNNNQLEEWPEGILLSNSLTVLVLINNSISNLTSASFENLVKLEIIDMSMNKIQYLSEKAFKKLEHLRILVMSHNKLISIPDILFKYTPRVIVLVLDNNLLKNGPNLWELQLDRLDLSYNDINYFTSSNMSSIKKLDLSYNQLFNVDIYSTVEKMNISHNSLSHISANLWTELIQVKEVDLGGNDFECCLFGNSTYLNEIHFTEILNLGSKDPLTCSIDRTSPKILLQTFVYNETECNAFKEANPFRLAVVLPLALLILTGIIVAVTIYVYRYELIYVKHILKMKRIGAETDEERYNVCIYDAFVCYSAKNYEWVMRTLLPGLEGGPEGYRLCVHNRDFALGANIDRNIVASLEKSRKVILVLSADFIASKWCQWELEMANHKMFEEKRNYIILVELERLPRRSLPRHLRYLMDRTTYLEWPEGAAGAEPPEHKQRECLRRLQKAMGDSLRQRTGRDNEGFFTVLDTF